MSIVYAVLALLCLVLLFSPLASYVLCILVVFLYGSNIKQREMYIFSLLFSVSFSLIVSSKAFGISDSDDFVNYYQDYFDIVTGVVGFRQVLSRYSFGLEFGLPLLFQLSGFLFPVLTPHQLMFLLSFLYSMIFSSWVVSYTYGKYYTTSSHGYIIALSLLLLSPTAGSQLVRQGISLAILLFAITNERMRARYALLFIATAFHLTALPFFVISRILSRYRWKGFFFLLTILAGANYVASDILNAYADLPKLAYFAITSTEGVSNVDIGTLKWLLIAYLFIAISIITSKKSFSILRLEAANWAPFTLFYFILFLSVIQYPLLPTRISMLVSMLVLGYLTAIYVLISRLTIIKSAAFVVMFVAKLSIMIPSQDNSVSIYWHEYNWIGVLPGYYFLQ